MPPLDWYPFEKRYKYPHMMPGDVAIWEKFIDDNPGAFTKCAYDVAVGEGTLMDTVVNPESGGDVNRLYQRKIDVLAEKEGQYFVIEIKPGASTASLGQVRGYATLFNRDFPALAPGSPLIITDRLLPEMDYLAQTEGVRLIVA